jgi:hypothetical protein
MWRLGAFSRETGLIVRDYILQGVDGPMLKHLLDLDDSEYPVEYGQHDIPLEKLGLLAEYVVGPFTPDSSLDYELGLTSD